MTRTVRGFLGIDVGTTSMKAQVFSEAGEILGSASGETRWNVGDQGQVEASAIELSNDAVKVMTVAVQSVSDSVQILGIGITGMAETGVLVDRLNAPLMPAIAWFDERGKHELELESSDFRESFTAHTGLAYKAESSFSKLLWRKYQGESVPEGATWLNLLEYIAFTLTGAQFTEPSLASRTGLWDQNAQQPWQPALDRIGATNSLLPPTRAAGNSFGRVLDTAPAELVGAEVTVAGHDHLVGAVGAGAFGVNDLFNSCGTADVLVRSVGRRLNNDERASLVGKSLSAGQHVIPGATAILGATRSGLVLGRILAMLGKDSRESRAALINSCEPQLVTSGKVVVSEPPNWANEVSVSLRHDSSPSEVWEAALSYTLTCTEAQIDSVVEIAGSHSSAVAAGGWVQIDGIYKGKSLIMPGLTRSVSDQPGIRGAAIFAALASGMTDSILTAGIAGSVPLTSIKEPV